MFQIRCLRIVEILSSSAYTFSIVAAEEDIEIRMWHVAGAIEKLLVMVQ
jgi:hypothetical protein